MEDLQDLLDWTDDTVSSYICDKVSSFFEYGEQIVVGVSGGADSMTLLHCLAVSNKNFQIIAAHLNHKLRGKESDDDEKFVRNWCKDNNIRFICKRLDVAQIAKQQHISVELSGRNERYKFFNEIGGRIATAHTLSDRIETMLFNMTRGTGVKGFCSIGYFRDNIVRPLLSFTRAEIEKYCKINKIQFKNDSSNNSCDYTRNRIRHNVVTELKSINPKFEIHVKRLLDGLVSDENYLIKIANQELKRSMVENGIKVDYINSMDYPIKIRVINLFLKMNNIFATHEMLVRIINMCNNGFGRQSIFKNKLAVIHRGILSVDNNSVFEHVDILLPNKNEYRYQNFYFINCNIEQCDHFFNITKHLFLFMIDYGKILGNVHIRRRHPGDKLHLAKRPTKTLKALMQESRMPIEYRNKLVIMADDNGVFWSEKFGADVRVLPDKTTKKVLLIFKVYD